jgi:hypothetical protein
MSAETKNCQNCKLVFTIEPEDFDFYAKVKVPSPTFCPECRLIRRFSFRNDRYLFRRKDAHDGKKIFSGFPPEADVQTYDNKFWFGDSWDPTVNGKEFDFTKNFFDQFRELLSKAPVPSKSAFNLVNSDYCNEASDLKNCYLCFNTDHAENSAYLRKTNSIKDSLDLYDCSEDELCYECVNVRKSYQAVFSVDCESCVNVWFSKDCTGCSDCVGCANLVNKSYHIFNEPFSKGDYEKKVKELRLDSFASVETLWAKAEKFWLGFPCKFYHGARNINSIGEGIYDTKNVKYSRSISKAENLRFCYDLHNGANDSYDYSIQVDGSEGVYEYLIGGLGSVNSKFCYNCWVDAINLEYCIFCISSKDCFGCVGLHKKQYCILNKQYGKEEYFALRDKIVAHMDTRPYVDLNGRVYKYGEFFPFDLSPMAYNESLAQDFFPLTKEEAERRGYKWREQKPKQFDTTIAAKDMPDSVNATPDDFIKEIIECQTCKGAFRILEPELAIHKKIGAPLPRNCFECRFARQFAFVNPMQFYKRECMCDKANHSNHEGKCHVEFETTYAPDRQEIIYCEQCYTLELV